MDETEGLASRPLANHLLGYGFERIGPLGEIELPLSRAIYAFVACHQIKIYPYAGPDSWIQIKESAPRTVEAHEIFYIGRSKDARLRIYSHGRDLKSRTSGSPAKGSFVSLILYEAKRQNVTVDVFVLHVPDQLAMVDGLPVDLLHGWEEGLIQQLRPVGNRRK